MNESKKEKIINCIVSSLPNAYITEWSSESARRFCELVLDGEGIDYIEEDFINCGWNFDKKTTEIVKKYAEMYKEIYQKTDQRKAMEMQKVIEMCNRMINADENVYHKVNDNLNRPSLEDEITVKNNTYSNQNSNDLNKMLSEDQEEPFTINFGTSVPKELREEIINRVTPILEEARSKMEMEQGKVK